MTIPELKAKIETLDDVAKVVTAHLDSQENINPHIVADEIESMRNRLVGDLRKIERRSPTVIHVCPACGPRETVREMPEVTITRQIFDRGQ